MILLGLLTLRVLGPHDESPPSRISVLEVDRRMDGMDHSKCYAESSRYSRRLRLVIKREIESGK